MQRITAAGVAAALTLGGAAAVGAQEDGDAPRGPGVLEELVAAGTLTEAQADAVRDGVRERRQERRRGVVTAAAEAIGVEPRALASRLREGESIAAVAESEGVERQVVVDALVAAGAGRLDAARAERLVDATHHPR